MKIKLIILSMLLTTTFAFSQEQEKFSRQELGISFSNFEFDNVGLNYRIGSETGLWRFGIASGLYNNISEEFRDSLVSEFNNADRRLILKIGREQRFTVAEGLQIRAGAETTFSRYYSKLENSTSADFFIRETTASANIYSIGLLIGAIYQLNKNIYVGFEFLPNYSLVKSENSSISVSDGVEITSERKVTTSNFNFDFNANTFHFNIGFNF